MFLWDEAPATLEKQQRGRRVEYIVCVYQWSQQIAATTRKSVFHVCTHHLTTIYRAAHNVSRAALPLRFYKNIAHDSTKEDSDGYDTSRLRRTIECTASVKAFAMLCNVWRPHHLIRPHHFRFWAAEVSVRLIVMQEKGNGYSAFSQITAFHKYAAANFVHKKCWIGCTEPKPWRRLQKIPAKKKKKCFLNAAAVQRQLLVQDWGIESACSNVFIIHVRKYVYIIFILMCLR